MSTTVIREVSHNVWIFSCPFARYGVVPIGGRSTAIKLRSGDVWVLASTPLDSETKSKLNELGPVKFIVGPDAVHHLFLGDYKKQYPDAKLIAPLVAIERHGDKSLKFDGIWGKDAPETKYGFEDDIQACYFSGFRNKDVAFFHAESKSMIQADLLFNLPCTEQYSKTKSSGSIPLFGSFGPSSWLHGKLAPFMVADTAAMKRDVKTVCGWDFERIIPCHGDVIEGTGKQSWMVTYRAYID